MAAPKAAKAKSNRSIPSPNKVDAILATARGQFGYQELRPGQHKAIDAVLSGQDTLVIAPTGSGKSAIYQIAGLMLDGPVLVVSPLIALQKDQVDSIQENALNCEAVVINSTKTSSELKADLKKIKNDASKFIFLAPEQLAKEETLSAMKKAGVRLFVVDEAHCVSEWGHDFRPDYLQLKHVIKRLGHPVVLAMTATASPAVRSEIASRLGMRNPNIQIGGFDRPNLYLRVDCFKDADKKLEALLHRVRWAQKPGIVYVATRKEAETIMAGLSQEGLNALFYHGGLKASEREEIQDQFMTGEAEVIIATNAFGMGIDKADVRFVYHYQAPDSLDSYYQEIGRAGRDGERAEAILFFREQDIGSQAFHTGNGKVNAAEMESVVSALESSGPLSQEALADATKFSCRRLTTLLCQLEDGGLVECLPSGKLRLRKKSGVAEAVQEAAEEASQQHDLHKQRNKQRLEQRREYAATCRCRRVGLLSYFGEEFAGPCGFCDVCEAESPEAVLDPSIGTRCEVV